MKLSDLKYQLQEMDALTFHLPDGTNVPKHFHITEVGQVTKKFIDCGGTLREEQVVSLQLWHSIDFHHRLKADKLLKIIEMAETNLNLEDAEIEVEYQSDTIGKYGLEFKEGKLNLTGKKTDCLAKSDCGIATVKEKINLKNLVQASESSCTPGSGCC